MKISKIHNLGRIVIPITYRKQLGISANDSLSILKKGKHTIISPLKSMCKLCGCDIGEEQKMQICDEFIKRIKEL